MESTQPGRGLSAETNPSSPPYLARKVWGAVRLLAAAVILLALPGSLRATTLPAGFAETRLPFSLFFPSSLAVTPDGRVLVGERNGNLRVVKNDQLLATPFVSLTVESSGERGLIGITCDPNFTTNGYIYVYYTATTPVIHNRVSRFTADPNNPDVALPGSEFVLLDLDPLNSNQHNSGALNFGPDGKLYIDSGDNYDSPNAQTLSNLKGKILRINPDGTIPMDNPFVQATTGKNQAIWALGLRNPFTAAIQPGTGRFFINDVGLISWDEINEGVAGSNYGWPATEGYVTDNSQYRGPVLAYPHPGVDPNAQFTGCAVTGGDFYNPASPQYPAQYIGKYFFIDFCGGWIKYMDPETHTVSAFADNLTVFNTTYLKIAPNGTLYYMSTADPSGIGALFKIAYSGNLAPQIGTQPVDQTVTVGDTATFTVSAYGDAPLGYQWGVSNNGGASYSPIPGATSDSYTTPATALADSGEKYRCVVTNGSGSATSSAATLTVTSNHAPVPTITDPTDGDFYNAGDTIHFAGTATDAEDGNLPASAFDWKVVFHHNTHIHPFMDSITNVKSGNFVIPTNGEVSTNVWFEVSLTVTDSEGMSRTTSVDVRPRVTQLNLATAPNAGLQLTLDGVPTTAPVSNLSVVNMTRSIGAVTPQTVGGITYDFVSWSDGGAATHDVSTPATNTTYTATFKARANGSISATPNPIVVTDGTGLGVAKVSWTTGSTTSVQVRINSPNGSLFAASGAGSFSSTTGKWVKEGTVFFLQNVSGGLPLTAANTLATVTVHLITRTGSISANPNPVTILDGTGVANTTMTWSSAGTSTVQVRRGSPTGTLYFQSGTGTWSQATGKYVSDGSVFYLQDISGGKPLTAANTLATVTVRVKTSTGTISATPNPIVVPAGQTRGTTTLNWSSQGATRVEVRINAPNGSLFSASGGGNRSSTTGNWVNEGMKFYLQDVSNGKPLTSDNTLATVTVHVTN